MGARQGYKPQQIMVNARLQSHAHKLAQEQSTKVGFDVADGWALTLLAYRGAGMESEAPTPKRKGKESNLEKALGTPMSRAEQAAVLKEAQAKVADLAIEIARKRKLAAQQGGN